MAAIGAVVVYLIAVLGHVVDDELDHFFNPLEAFLARIGPRRSAVAFECRTIGVPAISIRLDDNSYAAGVHVVLQLM
jgi:hypothetical protein